MGKGTAGCLYACKCFYHIFGTLAALRTVLIVNHKGTLPCALVVRSYKLMSFIKAGRQNSVPRIVFDV